VEVTGGGSIHVGSNNLEWSWKAGRERSNFQADLLNNARTVWPRTTKFGKIAHVVFLGLAIPQTAMPQSSPILGVPFYFCVHPLSQNYQIWHIAWGRGMYPGVSQASHPKKAEFQGLPNFSPVFMPTPFNAERTNSAWWGACFGRLDAPLHLHKCVL